jgi:hypothetical protein
VTVPDDVFSCCCDWGFEINSGYPRTDIIFSTSGTPTSGNRTKFYSRTDISTSTGSTATYMVFDVDSAGSMYAVVYSARTSVAKLNEAGTTTWTKSRTGSALYTDICVNSALDVFTIQSTLSISHVQKLNSSGTQQWITEVNSGGTEVLNISTIGCDASGNCFAAGQEIDGTQTNGWGAYFDSSGTELWHVDARLDLSEVVGESDAQSLIANPQFDTDGNVYFGFSTNQVSTIGGTDPVYSNTIFKFDSSGTEVWRKAAGSRIKNRGLSIDRSGNLYVLYDVGSAPSVGIYLRKYTGPDHDDIEWDVLLATASATGNGAVRANPLGDVYVFINQTESKTNFRIRASDGSVLQSATIGSTSGNFGLCAYPGRVPNF